MSSCVSHRQMRDVHSAIKIVILDLCSSENLLEVRKVDIGLKTGKILINI